MKAILNILQVICIKLLLFLSAYAPLGVIWMFILGAELPFVSLAIGILVALSLVALLGFLSWMKTVAPTRREINHAQRRDEQLVGYIVTYTIPFLADPSESTSVAIALGIFFFVVCALQVKLNLLYINPILAVFNYHMYEVDMKDKTHILLSKKENPPIDEVWAISVANTVLIDNKKRP